MPFGVALSVCRELPEVGGAVWCSLHLFGPHPVFGRMPLRVFWGHVRVLDSVPVSNRGMERLLPVLQVAAAGWTGVFSLFVDRVGGSAALGPVEHFGGTLRGGAFFSVSALGK